MRRRGRKNSTEIFEARLTAGVFLGEVGMSQDAFRGIEKLEADLWPATDKRLRETATLSLPCGTSDQHSRAFSESAHGEDVPHSR